MKTLQDGHDPPPPPPRDGGQGRDGEGVVSHEVGVGSLLTPKAALWCFLERRRESRLPLPSNRRVTRQLHPLPFWPRHPEGVLGLGEGGAAFCGTAPIMGFQGEGASWATASFSSGSPPSPPFQCPQTPFPAGKAQQARQGGLHKGRLPWRLFGELQAPRMPRGRQCQEMERAGNAAGPFLEGPLAQPPRPPSWP